MPVVSNLMRLMGFMRTGEFDFVNGSSGRWSMGQVLRAGGMIIDNGGRLIGERCDEGALEIKKKNTQVAWSGLKFRFTESRAV